MNEKIINKIKHIKKLNKEEEIHLEYLLPRLDTKSRHELLYLIISGFLCGDRILNKNERIISKELFEKVIKMYVETLSDDLKCEIKENDNNLATAIGDDLIIISPELVDIIYTGKDHYCYLFGEEKTLKNKYTQMDLRYEAVKIIFHEYMHIVQTKRARNSEYTLLSNVYIKESILCFFYKNFYEENYNNLIMEKEAEANSEILMGVFSHFLGTANDALKTCDFVNRKMLKEDSFERILNDKKIDLNLTFDKFIEDKPEILSAYPVLLGEYSTINGIVVTKTMEEMIIYISENPYLSDGFKTYLYLMMDIREVKKKKF